MKFNHKITRVLLLAGLLATTQANAEISATGGFVSDYYFRGINLGDGGAYTSVDFEKEGFSAGTWWIDDGNGGNDGLETDYYIAYTKAFENFSASFGYNRYEYSYTSDFEQEFVINLSSGDFSFDIVSGSDDDDGLPSEDYSVYILGYSQSYFGVTIGTGDYDDLTDASWSWLELSFSGDIVEGVSASLNLGVKTDDLTGTQDDGYIYLDISKSFDL